MSIVDVSGYLHATFSWLDNRPVTWPIVDHLRSIFTEHDIEVVAPSRGAVLRGRDIVARHLALVVDVLEAAAQPADRGGDLS